jgi:hypothetical protein
MKKISLNLLFLFVMGFALSSCAPTMYVQTEGDSTITLNKNAPHYIVPPEPSDSIQTRNLYPMVVEAFRKNNIALTDNRHEASYLVTWGSRDNSTQVHTFEALPTYATTTGNVNLNSYDSGASGYGTYSETTTGTDYVLITYTYNMRTFIISIWRRASPGSHESVIAWHGGARAGLQDVNDPAVIIDDIVARYGTNSSGNAEIKAPAPKN